MIQKDEGTGDKKLEEMEACKKIFFIFIQGKKGSWTLDLAHVQWGFFRS